MAEVWSPIPFYPLYQASSLGRIRSLPRWVRVRGGWGLKPGTILKPRVNTTDRLQVTLYLEDKPVAKSVHSLVCSAFYGPHSEEKPWALHRNGDHQDNRAENLYWGTPKENAQDTKTHGNNFEANKTHCVRNHEYTPENTYLRPDGKGRQCRKCIVIRGKKQSESKRLGRTLEKAQGGEAR